MKKGFTLIELMVVVAIIGVLAAITFSKFNSITDSGKVAQVQGNLANLRTTIGIFYTETGSYPIYNSIENNSEDISSVGSLSERFIKYYSKSNMPTTPSGTIRSGDNKDNFIGETSKVLEVRDNSGGWIYIEGNGEIYANLIDGNYTGDIQNEVWQEEVEDNRSIGNPDIPSTPDEWDDFINKENVYIEGSNGYGSVTFNQGDSGSTITPSEWHGDWEKVYVYDEDGNLMTNPNSEDGSYGYGDAIPVENNNVNDYTAVLEKTDPNTGEKIYIYSKPK